MTADKEYKAVSWISLNLEHILPTDVHGWRKIPRQEDRLNLIFHYFANVFIVLVNFSQTALQIFLLNITVTHYNPTLS